MNKRLTLLDRLKPEIKASLEAEKPNYSTSINMIFATLKDTDFYMDLKISDVQSIHTFSHVEVLRISSWDLRYGEHLFINRSEFENEFEQDNIDKDKILQDVY
jgi:hypothetical protein|tara:strand:- start:280 stop:588 length:309 start_codon:yes stop_codon:yes gene_type:complete